MSLAPGSRVGSYEVVAPLGAGAMGEVYRARDTDLGREVALKTLPASFATDSGRIARIRREAQILASLNHPHIAAIYGLTSAGETPVLVLELVEGRTLADVIAEQRRASDGSTRRIELQRSLSVARQIADALEVAHEKGIIHRDLKPANVKIRPDGTVKVLDFGIAKTLESEPEEPVVDETKTAPLTRAGALVGTVAYMSPEQARGAAATRQSDIWAFGVMLFQLLSGQRPFNGPSESDVIAAVLQSTPDWSLLPTETPPGIRRLVQRCLARDPKTRLHDIGDARLEIEDAEQTLAGEPAPEVGTAQRSRVIVPSRSRTRVVVGLGALILIAALAATGYLWWTRREPAAAEEVRLQLPPPEGTRFVSVPAVSPDGRSIAFVAMPVENGVPRLWLRRLSADAPTVLAGTEGASYPFWSPDGRSLAFFADTSLKRMEVSGGAPVVIAAAPVGRGGLWLDDESIVFAPSQFSPLMRVGAAGGQPVPFTTLAEDESGHRFPQRLPGQQLLYFSTNRAPEKSGVRLISRDDPQRQLVFFPSSTVAEYSNGFLLIQQGRGGRLIAQRLSLPDGQLIGEPVDVGSPRISETFGRLVMAASQAGVVAFLPAEDARGQFTWMSRDGRVLDTVGSPEVQLGVELSPSGQELATYRSRDIWLLDLVRAVPNKVTRGDSRHPIWSPDGTEIVTTYQGRGIGTFDLEITSATTGSSRPLLQSTFNVKPIGFTRDGQLLVFSRSADKSLARDIWTTPLSAPGNTTPYLQDGAQNLEARLSPDDRWIAYATDRSGRFEIEVRSFPVPGARHVVSLEGGGHPRWRADGRELYFLSANSRIMAVSVSPDSPPRFGKPTALFEVSLVAHRDRANFAAYEYDVSADGSRFLVNRLVSQPEASMTVIVNWSPARSR